jgi:predicted Zn-dependent protease
MAIERTQIARAALVAASLLACGWFALGIRQTHEQQKAASLINRHAPTAAEIVRAGRLLDAASELNPDAEPNLLRAQLAFNTGRRARAERIARGMVRREPENIDAWLLLGIATNHVSPQVHIRAQERVRELAGRPLR